MKIHFEVIKGLPDFDYSKTYYYSGPMSGYPAYNEEQFKIDTEILRSVGIVIETPTDNQRPKDWEFLEPDELWQVMMNKAFEQMARCEGIIMMKGWPQSKGAVRELGYALGHDWPVFFYDNYVLTSMNKEGVT